MTKAFSESVVEDAALAWLEGLGYGIKHGPDISPAGDTFTLPLSRWEREWYCEVAAKRIDYGRLNCQTFRWRVIRRATAANGFDQPTLNLAISRQPDLRSADAGPLPKLISDELRVKNAEQAVERTM